MTLAKPFSDPEAGSLLAQIGMVITLIPNGAKNLLDLGCGSGWTSNFFSSLGIKVLGQDISNDAIKLARKNFQRDNLSFVCSDYEGFGLKNKFDVAVFFDCLHHAENIEAALTAVHAALKSGGQVIISEPGKGHSKSEHSKAAMEKYGVTEEDMPPKKVIRYAKKAGFRSWEVYPDIGLIQRALTKKTFNRSLLKYVPGGFIRYIAVQYLLLFRKSFQGIVVLHK